LQSEADFRTALETWRRHLRTCLRTRFNSSNEPGISAVVFTGIPADVEPTVGISAFPWRVFMLMTATLSAAL